jgi:serine/threonine-protein kinase
VVSTRTEVEIGAEFLGYRIESVVGKGGMGVVYRAYDLRLKRTVAVKLMAPELALDERFRARFGRETELAMSLEHPNVVPIYDAGEVEGRLYLAMRHVDGTDLRALLRAEAPLDSARALAITRQVAAALDAAHARGLVHRDVKPSNVLLDEDEHVYLADFGLTRRLEEEDAHPGEGRSLGTPAYLAPEQIEGGLVDGRADVYSLGCVFYECLVGKAPFSGDSRLAVAWAHLEEEPPSASLDNPDLPEAIDPVFYKALAKEPDERYPTCAALIADGEEALGLRQPPLLRRRRLLLVAIAAVIVVLAAALVAGIATRDDGDSAQAPLYARTGTLVRIDPATNTVTSVIDVGEGPAASAVGGDTVWVYNRFDWTVSEIDGTTGEVQRTTEASGPVTYLPPFTGPVLAADAAGAWLIGVDGSGRSLLTRLLADGGGKHEYRLDHEPRAVAVGYGAVWVVIGGARGQLLRIDQSTGTVTARTHFSSPIDSITVGLGAVWVVGSSSATLYRIDPRTADVSGRVDLREQDLEGAPGSPITAARPLVAAPPPDYTGDAPGMIWVVVERSDFGDPSSVFIDPLTLSLVDVSQCCPPAAGYFTAGYGSNWHYDRSGGRVIRLSAAPDYVLHTIPLVETGPEFGGPCLTSIAAGAGGVWVTVSDPNWDGNCLGL